MFSEPDIVGHHPGSGLLPGPTGDSDGQMVMQTRVTALAPDRVATITATIFVIVTDSQLAVLLRQAQWALDDAAHDLPAGRATPGRRAELAGTLEALALVLRAPVPDRAGPGAGA